MANVFNILNETDKVIIFGDFNLPDITWTTEGNEPFLVPQRHDSVRYSTNNIMEKKRKIISINSWLV